MNLRSLTPSGSGGGRSVSPAVNPFGFLHREIDRLFDDFTRGLDVAGQAQVNLVPSIDVAETDKEIVITAEMPGLERKDVEISLENDMLTIRGEKKFPIRRNRDAPRTSADLDRVENFARMGIKNADRATAARADVNFLPIRRDPDAHRSGTFRQRDGFDDFVMHTVNQMELARGF